MIGNVERCEFLCKDWQNTNSTVELVIECLRRLIADTVWVTGNCIVAWFDRTYQVRDHQILRCIFYFFRPLALYRYISLQLQNCVHVLISILVHHDRALYMLLLDFSLTKDILSNFYEVKSRYYVLIADVTL